MADVLPLSSLNILLIEDTQADAEMIRIMVEKEVDQACSITHVCTIATAVEKLSKGSFQLALLDLSLPDAEGFSGLLSLQTAAPALPVVVLTAFDHESTALAMVERGAQDYLIKDRADTAALKRAMYYAICRKQFEGGIIRQANYDPLTGLANRVLFESRLAMALARARRTGEGIGVFFLDLNDFKGVNDQYGHAAGDTLLQDAASRLTQALRPYDTAARFGGDEFALLVEGLARGRDCLAVATKIIERFEEPFMFAYKSVQIGISIGIATSLEQKDEELTPEQLMLQADEAMYRAKCSPKSSYCFYTQDMYEEARVRMRLEEDLRQTVRLGQLMLCYQPRQSLNDGRIRGLEALVRWKHPERGLLLPAEFMAVAEETAMAGEIGGWVLAEVCHDMARWRQMKLPAVQVSVNVTPAQLDDPTFVDTIMVQLGQHTLPTGMLAVEVPEAAFFPLTPTRESTLTRLRDLGVTVCLDGFGRGGCFPAFA